MNDEHGIRLAQIINSMVFSILSKFRSTEFSDSVVIEYFDKHYSKFCFSILFRFRLAFDLYLNFKYFD